MKKVFNKIKLLLAVTPALAVLLVSGTALATPPTDSYVMTGNCSGTPCGAKYTLLNNPSNYYMRAWVQCLGGQILYGGWWKGIGQSSSTGSCATYGTYAGESGFQYDKTHKYQVVCWAVGDPNSGKC
jgi:hypothetical protein